MSTDSKQKDLSGFAHLPWSKRPLSDKALWVTARAFVLFGGLVVLHAGADMYQNFKCGQDEACLSEQAAQAKEDFRRTRGADIAREFMEAEKEASSGLLPNHPEIVPESMSIKASSKRPGLHP